MLNSEFICKRILSEVSGINGFKSTPINLIPSRRLYKTSFRRSVLLSSFASAHGSVSSMYLLSLRAIEIISSRLSAARNSFILAITSSFVLRIKSLTSPSTSSVTPVFVIIPSKYLLLIATVLFTRFPSVFARSPLQRAIMFSYVIVPSCA